MAQLNESQVERSKLNERIQEVVRENKETNERMQEEFERIQGEKEAMGNELQEMYEEKSEKDVIIKTLTNENLELNSKLSQLEQLLCAKEDQDCKMDELQESYNKLMLNKDKYKKDLEICTNYLLEVEEKC